MSAVAIRVGGLGKRYRIGRRERYYTLRDTLMNVFKAPFGLFHANGRQGSAVQDRDNTIWALKDVSFEVQRGEVVGIIGRNGAGKSTLLKILSRVTDPTEGYAEVYGRVGSLLEVGTGFHPELTGRENIYLNGAILGMKRREIERKFDEIVAFAEVEKFIDTPVKHFSSGMYLRLAFSVAAHLEPEILLVDEVLAVGDAAFQKKSLGKIGAVAKAGRTVLFVSHNMGAVSELCGRAILLHQGRQVASGNVAIVLEAYSRLNNRKEYPVPLLRNSSLPCSIIELKLYRGDGLETSTFDIGDDIVISIVYRIMTKLHGLQVVVTLSRNMVEIVHSFDTDQAAEILPRDQGLYQARHTIPRMFLKAGIYSVRITVGTPDRLIQDFESALHFEVEERSVNAQMKGYRRDRPGHVISPGFWQTVRLE